MNTFDEQYIRRMIADCREGLCSAEEFVNWLEEFLKADKETRARWRAYASHRMLDRK